LNSTGLWTASTLSPLKESQASHPSDRFKETSNTTTRTSKTPSQLHQHCSSSSICPAYQADEANYSIRHLQPWCSCTLVSPDTSRIAQTIENGQVPLVQIGGSIHVLSSRSCEYIAIPYVWSDDLGNPWANNMLVCRWICLALSAMGVRSDSLEPWWRRLVLIRINTICCPGHDKQDRLLAIRLINRTNKMLRSSSSTRVLFWIVSSPRRACWNFCSVSFTPNGNGSSGAQATEFLDPFEFAINSWTSPSVFPMPVRISSGRMTERLAKCTTALRL
jgi:hypothetical protein